MNVFVEKLQLVEPFKKSFLVAIVIRVPVKASTKITFASKHRITLMSHSTKSLHVKVATNLPAIFHDVLLSSPPKKRASPSSTCADLCINHQPPSTEHEHIEKLSRKLRILRTWFRLKWRNFTGNSHELALDSKRSWKICFEWLCLHRKYFLRRDVFISLCYTQIKIASRNDFHRKLYDLLFSNRLGTYLAGFIIATRSNNFFAFAVRGRSCVSRWRAGRSTWAIWFRESLRDLSTCVSFSDDTRCHRIPAQTF